VPFRAYSFRDHRVQILQLSFSLLEEILSLEKQIFYGNSVSHNLIVLNLLDVQSVIIKHIRTEGDVLFKDPIRTMPQSLSISDTKTVQLMLSVK
jgi:hypothetical protein